MHKLKSIHHKLVKNSLLKDCHFPEHFLIAVMIVTFIQRFEWTGIENCRWWYR